MTDDRPEPCIDAAVAHLADALERCDDDVPDSIRETLEDSRDNARNAVDGLRQLRTPGGNFARASTDGGRR